MTEEWRPVPGWEYRYEVSDMGRVRSLDMLCKVRGDGSALRRGRMLVQVPSSKRRYLLVMFTDGERREQHGVHLVVLTAFVGPKPEGYWGLHRDDDKGNNALSNLYWGTPQDNANDRIKNGRSLSGEAHPWAKLTADQVREIRTSKGVSYRDLAERFNTTAAYIYSIRAGKVWKHI